MPFYFQAALDNSPLRSGVNYMSLAVPQMIGLLAGGGIVTVWGQYVRLPSMYTLQRLTVTSLDADHIVVSSPVWYWIRLLNHAPDRHLDCSMGNLYGLNRTWTWDGSQCASHSDSSCYGDVSEPFPDTQFFELTCTHLRSDNDIFIANGKSRLHKPRL